MADIHDRMPVILRPEDYDRWLGIEPDPRDLLRPFPAELMRMWPISTRVNSPKNDDPDLLTPVAPDSSTSPDSGAELRVRRSRVPLRTYRSRSCSLSRPRSRRRSAARWAAFWLADKASGSAWAGSLAESSRAWVT